MKLKTYQNINHSCMFRMMHYHFIDGKTLIVEPRDATMNSSQAGVVISVMNDEVILLQNGSFNYSFPPWMRLIRNQPISYNDDGTLTPFFTKWSGLGKIMWLDQDQKEDGSCIIKVKGLR